MMSENELIDDLTNLTNSFDYKVTIVSATGVVLWERKLTKPELPRIIEAIVARLIAQGYYFKVENLRDLW